MYFAVYNKFEEKQKYKRLCRKNGLTAEEIACIENGKTNGVCLTK